MPQVQFELPTLVTLTAPTCAGKNFLLEALVEKLGFSRIVSTTNRSPRAGEVEGVHYNFIDSARSLAMEAAGQFAELITYNGVRYGVTNTEMIRKMSTTVPPMVILEPQGLEIYRKVCVANGWQLFSIYVSAPENIRLKRLTERTAADVVAALRANELTAEAVSKVIATNNNRMSAIFNQERGWISKHSWDLVVDGTNVDRSVSDVAQAIASRNRRVSVYK